MSFAAAAIIILLVLLPGVIFRLAYTRGQFETHPFRTAPIGEEVAYGAVFAVIIHSLAIWILHVRGVQVNYVSVLALMYGPSAGNAHYKDAAELVQKNPSAILGYFLCVYAAAGASGYLIHLAGR